MGGEDNIGKERRKTTQGEEREVIKMWIESNDGKGK